MLKYQHRIAKLIARYVQDPADVLDVAQEAFMKAYRAIPKFRGDSAFYTWMYRIAINTAKNHLAAQARRPRDSGVDVADAEQFDGAVELKETATPEGLALTEEIQRTVAAAIEALPEDLKVAVFAAGARRVELRGHRPGHGMPRRHRPIEDLSRP